MIKESYRMMYSDEQIFAPKGKKREEE